VGEGSNHSTGGKFKRLEYTIGKVGGTGENSFNLKKGNAFPGLSGMGETERKIKGGGKDFFY